MTTKLRETLAKLVGRPAELAKALPSAFTLSHVAPVLAIRSGGVAVTSAKRDELLELVMAGKHVELEIDMLAFEQEAGKRNRNSVRFRDGMLLAFGRSGVGSPFLKDHNKWEMEAKGGAIIASRTEKLAEGHYQILQTAKITARWATEMALRGLLDAVSIHWSPTGPVLCSACDAPIFTLCYHFPGERLAEKDLGGKVGKKLVRDPNGDLVVEWIYTDGELRETSAVPIGGVPTAQVKDVRAAMFASLSAVNPGLVDDLEDADQQEDETNVKHREALIALLGLAATASDDEILSAVEKRSKEATADKAALAIVQTELSGFKTEIDGLKADKRKREEDKFVGDALSSGRIAKGDEEHWRALFAADEKRATELMAKREAGSATPVGLPRQSGGEPALIISGGIRVPQSLAQRRDAAIAQLKANPQAAAWACMLGLDPKGRFDVPTQLMSGTTISNDAQLEPARIGFNAAFLEAAAGEPDPTMMLATETTSSKKEESYSFVGDLPGMEEWKTDRMLKVLEAYGFAIRNKKWEASLKVKNDDIADDALGLLGPILTDMAGNARLHPGILVARLLLNGFDGSAFPDLGDGLAFDGEFFFSDDHETGSNLLAVAFSAVNLDTAAQKLRKQKRLEPGAKEGSLYAKGTHLFVGVADELLAEKILTQEVLANGESNTNRNKYKLVVTPEFADGEWMLADLRGAVRPVLFQNREPLTTSTVGGRAGGDSVGFMYDELWMGARARYNAGYLDFRRIVGSKP